VAKSGYAIGKDIYHFRAKYDEKKKKKKKKKQKPKKKNKKLFKRKL